MPFVILWIPVCADAERNLVIFEYRRAAIPLPGFFFYSEGQV